MSGLESLDLALFHFFNTTLSNPLFDVIMPAFSGNVLFVPALGMLAAALIWKGGARGRVCLLFLVLAVLVGDGVICSALKKSAHRERPCHAAAGARVLVGCGHTNNSMPSSHAANWFAATVVMFRFYRRSLWFMLPLAGVIAVSRVYNGVHYPADVAVGAILGAAYAAGLICGVNLLWKAAGPRWFPFWHARLPSLTTPRGREEAVVPANPATLEQHWLRLGHVLIAVLLLARLGYLAAGKIELSEDEAYQWLWSKHLALSYYSKPPLIAVAQFLGTTLWGDHEFGVRFFSPVIAAALSLMLLRFMAREVNVRAGFWLVLIATATPLLSGGAILMTVDPLSVLFWTAAMLSGWQAVKHDSTRHWAWTGLWMGLGFLSKYTGLFQWLAWAVFLLLWKPARPQLRRPGPYLALGINLLCALPVLAWNAQHDWITMTHLGERGGLSRDWSFTLRHLFEFLGAEIGLLNPVFFAAGAWAAVAFWKRERRNPLMVYLFSMGAPLFLFHLLFSFRSRVLPNWIAPAVLPLLCLMTAYWHAQWPRRSQALRIWLGIGVGLGLATVVLAHETNLLTKIAGVRPPPRLDPLRRVRAWKETARVVGEARRQLLSEGKPVYIIGGHYGITSLVTFYLPEAKAAASREPIVFCRSYDVPKNQFHFWPGYDGYKGANAIYVQEVKRPEPPPERLLKEFGSVVDLGVREVYYGNRVFHLIQLYECRDLR